MSEEELVADAQHLTSWQQHKFMVLVGLTIVLSLILVSISLWLYNESGAAQLDLSRPGYESIRSQASKSNDFTEFPEDGVIDKKALDEFRKLYDKQLEIESGTDGFGSDVMSDEALGISAQSTAE